MKQRRISLIVFVAAQFVVVAAFGAAYFMSGDDTAGLVPSLREADRIVEVERDEPLRISSLYDDPEVVSDEELAAVLKQIRPRFPRRETKPNYVEHALRTWSVHAEFGSKEFMSGPEMKEFLTDHGKYLASWGNDVDPLLVEKPHGVAIRWGSHNDSSVHHDHWLASLTEAGIHRHEPVYVRTRREMTIDDVLQESLRDFRLDERETEWSAMAFGLWIAPVKQWRTGEGRIMSFDQIARRLIRGHQRFGVCAGTHRVYSLAVLTRLDDEFDILSDEVRAEVYEHLKFVRDQLIASQFPEGYWPTNWSDGKAAVTTNIIEDPEYRRVIATGHQLEWLAIVPEELHPPHEMILKAADWIIASTVENTEKTIGANYTFYSHVGNALALWRSTTANDFWQKWRQSHTEDEIAEAGETLELPETIEQNIEPAADDSGLLLPPPAE